MNAHNNVVQYKNTVVHPAGSTLFERGTAATVAIPQDGRKEGQPPGGFTATPRTKQPSAPGADRVVWAARCLRR